MPTPTPTPSPRGWQVIACDLDGTLLDNGHPNPTDLAALRRARDAGLHIALATGRNALESAKYIQMLNLTGPGVFVNGGTICEQSTGKTLLSDTMPTSLVDEVVDFFGTLGHAVLGLCDDPVTNLPHYVLTQHGVPHRATTEWLLINKMKAHVIEEIEPRLRDRVVRLGIVVNVPESATIVAALRDRFGPRIFSYSIYAAVFDCQVIEVFNPHVTKWTGIQKLCQLLNVDPARAVAIGDDVNDLPMLQNASLSFAMGNATPAVQAAAKHVTLPQSNAGIAHMIDGLLSGKW